MWRKSSRSGGDNGQCVEVVFVSGWVGVRDTKRGTAGPVLAFTEAEWLAFVVGVRDGELAGP